MTTQALPNWQLHSIFPSLDSSAFTQAFTAVEEHLTELDQFLQEHGIDSEHPGPAASSSISGLIERFNETLLQLSDLHAYLITLVTTDAFNEQAQARLSELQALVTRLTLIDNRATAWLGTVSLADLTAGSEVAAAHSYRLERKQQLAARLLPAAAEQVVAQLEPSAATAWAQLHGALVSRDTIGVRLPGREEADYTVSDLFILQADAEGAVRRAAYEAQLELLARNEVSFAAALNSIKGHVGLLARERGWASPLDEALFQNGITRQALSALQEACAEAFPLLRRYLKAKARHLGKAELDWYDLFAPVGSDEHQQYSWEQAREFIVSKFRVYSADLADFADRAFAESWLDAPSRKGKTNGAYCIPFPGKQESRIMLNFGGRLDDLFTLAHELGHAYHNEQLYRAGRTPLQSGTPMTLAETASIFCETIVFNAVLEEAGEAGKLQILEQDLAGAAQLLLDIHSRFLFEQALFAQRAERELSVSELNELMLQAQEETYGDGLAAGSRHRLMWAFKGHYYSANRSFYNYPYTFGYLFGVGLYQEFLRQPAGFQERYSTLLSSTGLASAKDLAAQFGSNIEDPAFWRASLKPLADRVASYERLVGS